METIVIDANTGEENLKLIINAFEQKRPVRLTRNSLHTLVWHLPTIQLSRILHISDVMIGKICKEMNIPKPNPGYWAKKESNRRLLIPKLKQPKKTSSFQSRKLDFSPNPGITMPSKSKEIPPAISFPQVLTEPLPIIEKAQKAMLKSKSDDYNHLVSTAGLPIRVSKNSINDSLIIYDTLLKELLKRGHKVINKSKIPEVIIFENSLLIQMQEKNTRTETKRTRKNEHIFKERYIYGNHFYEYEPNGILRIYVDTYKDNGAQKGWSAKNAQELKKKLGKIVIGLEHLSKNITISKQKAEEKRIQWEIEMQQAHQQQLEEAKESRRKEDFQKIIDIFDRHNRFLSIKNSISKLIIKNYSPEKTEKFLEYMEKFETQSLKEIHEVLNNLISDL